MKRIFTFLFLLVSAISYAQVDLNLGLLIYYPFTGNANDASGNDLNAGTFNGVQLSTDRYGNANSAYLFDGVDDYIKVSDNGFLSTPAYSICYFFNTEITAYQNCIGKINYNDGNAATYNSGIFQPGSSLYFATIADPGNCNVQINGTLVYTMFAGAIQTNEWHCVVNTFENGIQKLYIDGTLFQTTTLPFTQSKFCDNTDFIIGSWWAGDPFRFKGKIDDVRFYNRAINQDEVTTLCSTVAPVTLTAFKASANNKTIRLTWNTEAEAGIDNYIVKRSASGYEPDFISLGTVASKTNSHSNEYVFIDNTAKPNTLYYYKLMINDLDGSKKYSPTRTAKISNSDFYTLIYPNPTDGIIKVFINNAVSDVHIKVMNNLGQLITEKKSAAINTNPVLLDISYAANGMYWVIIESEAGKTVEKIIKQ